MNIHADSMSVWVAKGPGPWSAGVVKTKSAFSAKLKQMHSKICGFECIM